TVHAAAIDARSAQQVQRAVDEAQRVGTPAEAGAFIVLQQPRRPRQARNAVVTHRQQGTVEAAYHFGDVAAADGHRLDALRIDIRAAQDAVVTRTHQLAVIQRDALAHMADARIGDQ